MAAQAVAYSTTRRAGEHADKKLGLLKQVLKSREGSTSSSQKPAAKQTVKQK